jgi:hypothetical protein
MSVAMLSLGITLCMSPCFSSIGDEVDSSENIPDWVHSGDCIHASAIPEENYLYLANWLENHAKPAQQYFIDLFARHQIVIFGEAHNVKEHKDFIIDLIPGLYHKAGVRCIGWEFSRHTDNELLEKLVTAPEYDRELALQFARDQLAHTWDTKEHWDMIAAVWRLNKSLEPGQEKMRFLGLDMNVDFTQFFILSKTKPLDSPEFQEILTEILKRDRTMAEQVEKEIIEKGQKGLLFVGRCHDFTHYEFPHNVNFGRDIMGNLLYKKHGDRIFQIWPGPGPDMSPVIEKVMEHLGHSPIGFDLYASPFANILSSDRFPDAPGVPMSNIARGYIYLGSRMSLHKNTPIEGFITDEMFRKYMHYYEIDLGRSFKDAEELDKYLQLHRFPEP